MRQALRHVVGAVCVVLLTAGIAWAQAGATAQINGTVRDTSGGVLPGVDVTVTQTDTNFTRSAVTDAEGNYLFSNLPTGPYRLQASLGGFRTFQRTGIVLQVNANPTIVIELAVGELAETVSVEAATPLVETRSPSVGQVIENDRIEELPLNGRNATDLIVLAGAAVPQPALNATSRSMPGGRRLPSLVVRRSAWRISLDGATHNNPYDNLNLPLPFPGRAAGVPARDEHDEREQRDALGRVGQRRDQVGNQPPPRRSLRVRAQSSVQCHQSLQRDRSGHRRATGRWPEPQPVRRHARRSRCRPTALFFFGAFQGTRLRETPCGPVRVRADGRDARRRLHAICLGPVQHDRRRDPARALRQQSAQPSVVQPRGVEARPRICLTTTDPCGRGDYSRSRPQDEAQYIGKVDMQLSPNHSLFGRYMLTTVRVDAAAAATAREHRWCRARAAATTRRTRSPSATRWC